MCLCVYFNMFLLTSIYFNFQVVKCGQLGDKKQE